MSPRKSQKAGVLEKLIQKEVSKAVKKTIKEQKLATSEDLKALTGELKQVRKQLGKAPVGKATAKAAGKATAKAAGKATAKAAGKTTLKKRAGRKPKFTTCTVRGCKKPHYAKGLCASHYQKQRREAAGVTISKGAKKTARKKNTRKKTAKK